MEAADLGVRLCQSTARGVYVCYGAVAVPVIALAVASGEIGGWIPGVLIWWLKPWLERTILFVLSRAAFGHQTSPIDVWRSQRQVLWTGLLLTLTVQRLSLWRSLTQPVYQLEGLRAGDARARVRQIRRGKAGSGLLITAAFSMAETALTFGALSLAFWFAPAGQSPDLIDLVNGETSEFFRVATILAYSLVVIFLEPFYVAAGFGVYLSRRAELEAWDLEQEFRRAFAT